VVVTDGPQTWTVTPARRDPRAPLHLGAAAGTLAAAPVSWAIFSLVGIEAPTGILVPVLGAIFLIGVVWALFAFRLLRRRSAQTVTLSSDAIEIVGSPTSPVLVRHLALRRIFSIEPPLAGPPGLVFFMEGWGVPVAIGGKDAGPALLAEVAGAVRRRIADLPDGPQHLEKLEARARARQRLALRVPLATLATAALLVLCFGLQWVASCVPLEASCEAMALAGAPDRVAAGQVYRLLTANLLHVDVLHLALNLLGLAAAGSLTELVLGWRRTALLYLTGGIAAQGGASAFTSMITVGASGSVYACFGALLWLGLRRSDELPGSLRFVHAAWLMVGLGILLELAMPRISSAAHIGGFLAGLLITPLLIGRRPLFVR
jgi:membrane associated rhomboid family serine protease